VRIRSLQPSGAKEAAEKSLLREESGPQWLRPDLFSSDRSGLKRVSEYSEKKPQVPLKPVPFNKQFFRRREGPFFNIP
jgi:hypothetical protein